MLIIIILLLKLFALHYFKSNICPLQKSPKRQREDFGQDGGIGRYTVPPSTTKRRTTTNLKTKNNQKCQKIELYRSPTTKELKEKHSFRLVGGVETGSWVEKTHSKACLLYTSDAADDWLVV